MWGWSREKPRYMVLKRSQVESIHWQDNSQGIPHVGFLKRNLQVNSSTLKAKAYTGLVCPQVEYCWRVWDSCPGVENNGSYKIKRMQCCNSRLYLRWDNNTSSITNMLEYMGWRTLEQCRIDSQPAALFKITQGLLSVNSNGLLRPVTHRSCCSRSKSFIPFKLACPLSILFLKNNGTICLLLS